MGAGDQVFGHLLLPSQTPYEEAGSEVEDPGCKPAHKMYADAPGHSLICYTTTHPTSCFSQCILPMI